MKPRILYFGTPEIAASVLEALCAPSSTGEVIGVVSRPDQPQGRRRLLQPTPVKRVALEQGLPLLQPIPSSDPAALTWMQELAPDIVFVLAYGEIVRQPVLDIARWGPYNLHASLLPRYRGAAPLERALMDGVEITGWSLQRMVLACDAGPVATSISMPVPSEMNRGQLLDAMIELAIPLVMEWCSTMGRLQGQLPLQPQDPSLVTWAPKITGEDLLLHCDREARSLHNQVRALSPEPGAYGWWQDPKGRWGRLRILATRTMVRPTITPPAPGLLTCIEGCLWLGTGTTPLQVLTLQPEGKRPMDASAFQHGYRSALPAKLCAHVPCEHS